MALSVNGQDTGRLAIELEHGLSLPASWYTDPAVLARERERIFGRAWQYVARTDQLTRVGDFVAGMAGDVPIVVVRNLEGLQAFVNICRHRRHLVVSGAGNRKVLQCPYHAWSYGLDGCLKAAPRAEREENFCKEDFPLLPARVDTWGPFVFVNADAAARPLADYLGELPNLLAANGVDLTRLQFQQRRERRLQANWKVVVENYLECYHCPAAHPGFSSVIDVDPDSYRLQAFEWFSVQHAPVLPGAIDPKGRRPAYDARGAVVRGQYYFLWPNFSLNINPGQPNLMVLRWLPEGTGQTCSWSEQYFEPGVPAEFKEQLGAFSKQVGDEDEALTASVQRGLQAGLPEQGRLFCKSEQLIIHFQKLVLQALAATS